MGDPVFVLLAQTAAASAAAGEVALLRALVPFAIAGLFGGLAVGLLRPSTSPREMLRMAALGLIVGSFAGAALPDLATLDWWGARYVGLRGVQLLACGVAGFGAQSILGRLQQVMQKGDYWPALRQGLRAWLLRDNNASKGDRP